jgi:signal transduction histidine kinase
MVVEDNPGDANLIQEMLEEHSRTAFQCRLVERLSVAIEQLSNEVFDIVLLDLSLPDSHGVETLIKLHTRIPALPLVVLTGINDETLGIQAVQQGAQDYLVKGDVTSTLLIRSVRYAIERKRSERQLELLAATLEQNNHELHNLYERVSELERLKTDMIRMASHDLLGLVGVMIGYLDILYYDLGTALTHDHKKSFSEVRKATKQMEQLTRDILSLERIESSASDTLSIFDLRSLVQTVAQQTQDQATHKMQEYKLTLSPTAVLVQGDFAQLQEAITNLIQNAIKYTAEKGTIHIRLSEENAMATFEVQDTGYGIPLSMQNRLFQAFFRATTNETKHIQGTGLGLYLVKRVIERHNGEIIFHSVQGEGSLFGFTLPTKYQP